MIKYLKIYFQIFVLANKMNRFYKIILVVLLFIFSGCATYYNPVTKKVEYTFYSEKDEIDMGVAMDKKLQKELKIVSTPAKIEEIGQKIANACDRPNLKYTFRVVEGEDINAFSIPGPFVYIYTGLLKNAEDDEIACVIGHEIGHICARDGVHRLQTQLLYSIPAAVLLSNARSEAIQKSVDTIFNLTMLKYSREDELRADALGVIYAYRAGYKPEGMITFFRKLQEIEKKNPKIIPAFLSDHPDIEERIKNVQATITNLNSSLQN